jgi:hypothetical protein
VPLSNRVLAAIIVAFIDSSAAFKLSLLRSKPTAATFASSIFCPEHQADVCSIGSEEFNRSVKFLINSGL